MSNKINIIISSISIALLVIASSVTLSSCSQEESISATEIQENILNAYMLKYYPNIPEEDNGLYILSNKEGNINISTSQYDTCYPLVHYSILTLDKTYSSTIFKDIAKQLGEYSNFKYYGSRVWTSGVGSISIGVERMLDNMKVGGQCTAIIPAWLSSDEVDTDMYNSTGSTFIYDIQLDTIVADIFEYETTLLKKYSDKYYAGLAEDSINFYFNQTKTVESDTNLVDGDAIKVWYVGKLLDGYVFDTNIKDTAIKYDIYTSSASYSPLSYTHYMTIGSAYTNNSFVHGFTKAMNQLNYGEKAETFFGYEWGYDVSGKLSNGVGIPPYTPMYYQLRVLTKDEEDALN
ncbi:MAG: FKBP-type peptidyl-prolyl cis-trans isomerase [Bacteroidales bacterium]